ncbi:uncharacterized protein LOC132199762 [Neocloeon triangulifer]|uniref:uncharacterized protein LOC132199762 n=1 Tax=Neocloeon triangulifer TaxID=2078957 RepID=UPI00286F2494|nr:uncharacterized protein LOC132199762 [Neocloeon triangulifer]
MTDSAMQGVNWKELWEEMLSDEIIANLNKTSKSSPNCVPTLRARMLLKVTFSELRGKIAEANLANRKSEEQWAKNDVLKVVNKNLNSEVAKLQEKLEALQAENQRLKESGQKRLSDEYRKTNEKRVKTEVKQKQASFFVLDTNLINSPSPVKNLSVPESLSQDEDFILNTPPKNNGNSQNEIPPSSPVITARRCSSALSVSTASPAPLSPRNTQVEKKETRKISKLSLKLTPAKKEPTKLPEARSSDLDRTFFEDDNEVKLFDTPVTRKQTKKEEANFGVDPELLKKYDGVVVRKKEERKKLPGWECHECKKFYDNFCDDMSTQEKREFINKCSKHRQVKPLVGNTPEGFWDFGIMESPKKGLTQKGRLNKRNRNEVGTRLIDKAQSVTPSLEDEVIWDD